MRQVAGIIILSMLWVFCAHTQSMIAQTNPAQPNVLLIIADDLGVDYSNGYQNNTLMPNTPNIDNLRSTGLTFTNAWASPRCTPTRAGILSGKYGNKTNVMASPGNLDLSHTSLFQAVENATGNAYDDALIGKWHISSPVDYSHPAQHGIDHYNGSFNASVSSYTNWTRIENGSSYTETDYATSYLTDDASNWINSRSKPWLLCLSHVAPHTPFHIPPSGFYTQAPTNSNKQKYVAMIEAMDYEIGQLLGSIPATVLNNTVIMFIGDNGTPTGVIQSFPSDHAKGTVYQGGVHVPMIVSGPGVTRANQTETALVHSLDIYASVLEITGSSLPGGIYNSMSFVPLLSNATAPSRPYNYTELWESGHLWAIRDSQYKLIQFPDGTQEFYDLLADPLESNNLISSLNAAQQLILTDLQDEALVIQTDWSCQDLIQNGSETSIDDGGNTCNGITPVCTNDNSTSTTNIGCCEVPTIPNYVATLEYNDTRYISSNNYPDHQFCYNPNNIPGPEKMLLQVDATPQVAASSTSILNNNGRPARFFGVGINGVLMAPAPATPFIFENPETGEYNWQWVMEATNNQGSGSNRVALDCASAHTGPHGYHYHGNMFEFAEQLYAGISTTSLAPADPIHIGWASDGFPILYRFAPDGTGGLALLQPSYQIKAGDRPGNGITQPCGPYNGKYTNDYEYVSGLGDLDECNGIARSVTVNTICGPQTFDYFYVITDEFPQIGRCLSGTPDLSFDSGNQAQSCLTSLHTQEVDLEPGQIFTVGTNTYNTAGTYQDVLINAANCDSIVVTKINQVPASGVQLEAKVLLEGPYLSSTNMSTLLQDNNLIPNQQPFNQSPWNYSGGEYISTIPSNIVDWLLIELIDNNNNQFQVAALLTADGFIQSTNGNPGVSFPNASGAVNYKIIIRARHHLAVASTGSPQLPIAGIYDFTQPVNVSGAANQLSALPNGLYALKAGDFDNNGAINYTDFNLYLSDASAILDYTHLDCNLDGHVTVLDYNLYRKNSSAFAVAEVRY